MVLVTPKRSWASHYEPDGDRKKLLLSFLNSSLLFLWYAVEKLGKNYDYRNSIERMFILFIYRFYFYILYTFEDY